MCTDKILYGHLQYLPPPPRAPCMVYLRAEADGQPEDDGLAGEPKLLRVRVHNGGECARAAAPRAPLVTTNERAHSGPEGAWRYRSKGAHAGG